MQFVLSESLERLGFTVHFQAQLAALSGEPQIPAHAVVARVLSALRGQFLVTPGEGTRRAILAGRLQHHGASVCVGDFVLLEGDTGDGLARIVHVFLRSSLFQRRAPGDTSQAQLIAANVDLAVVVCALAPDDANADVLRRGLNPRRIERYLRAIRDAPARALVALNKADLSTRSEEHAAHLHRELRSIPVVLVSAEAEGGLALLEAELLPGSTAVLVGSSGVGKSSLTNRLLGEPARAVSAVREDDTRGRHTTTGRELFVLPNGALLIDTPGMREFSIFADDDSELGRTGFAEIDELAPACRFRDCRHQNEPGCAVLAAVEAGSVASERVSQAHKLERELAWQRDRHDPRALSERRSVWRARTRANRAEMKNRR